MHISMTKSETANDNYLAKVVRINGLQKVPNSDFLQMVSIDHQNVVTGMDTKDGDIYVFFPVECQISDSYLRLTNSYQNKELNAIPDGKAGFFGHSGRVRAINLRGQKSMGYIVPIETVLVWAGSKYYDYDVQGLVGVVFDTVEGELLVKKYVPPVRQSRESNDVKKSKGITRLIDGQVRLHSDTGDLRKNSYKILPDDNISITYKTHGSSWWVSNLLTKRKTSLFDKVLIKLGMNIQELEYSTLYGSRRVIKNDLFEVHKRNGPLPKYDMWRDIYYKVHEFIPKGFTVYGEILGYDAYGKAIQKDYDYGCSPDGPTQSKLEVYRVTYTNVDGEVYELDLEQRLEFIKETGLGAVASHPHVFYSGKARDWHGIVGMGEVADFDTDDWTKVFISNLTNYHNDKDCFMCANKVPEEGIVVRKESLYGFEAYKLKSFRFLLKETEQLDRGEVSIEEEN